MRALIDDLLLDTAQSVEDDGTGAALDIVDRLGDEEATKRNRNSRLVYRSQKVRHVDGVWSAKLNKMRVEGVGNISYRPQR